MDDPWSYFNHSVRDYDYEKLDDGPEEYDDEACEECGKLIPRSLYEHNYGLCWSCGGD